MEMIRIWNQSENDKHLNHMLWRFRESYDCFRIPYLIPIIKEKFSNDLRDSSNKLNQERTKIKEKGKTKAKSEETKKELPPLPNLKIKEKGEAKAKSEETKKNKTFKVDKSFLKND